MHNNVSTSPFCHPELASEPLARVSNLKGNTRRNEKNGIVIVTDAEINSE